MVFQYNSLSSYRVTEGCIFVYSCCLCFIHFFKEKDTTVKKTIKSPGKLSEFITDKFSQLSLSFIALK